MNVALFGTFGLDYAIYTSSKYHKWLIPALDFGPTIKMEKLKFQI